MATATLTGTSSCSSRTRPIRTATRNGSGARYTRSAVKRDLRGEEIEDDVVDPPTHTDPRPDEFALIDSESDRPWKAGMVVGERYELLNQIGQGGFSAVFRARDRVADEIVALKALSGHPATDVVHLRREVQIARRIS